MITVEEFMVLIRRGVDYGRTPFKVQWQSEDKRFAVITYPGQSFWNGRGQKQKYGATEHWLVDLSKANEKERFGFTIRMACRVKEIEGRLTKARLSELIAYAK